MVRLSSLLTGWHKRTGPLVWFVLLGLAFLLLGWLAYAGHLRPLWLVAPPVLALASFLYFSRYTAVLVDDVQDAGEALLVRNRGRGWRIPLNSVREVGYARLAHPPRVILSYRDAAGVEDRLEFMPRLVPAMLLLRPPPVLDDLRRRAEAARGAAT